MIVDLSAFVGPYPFRHLAAHSPDYLLGEMARVGVEEAWVGHLPSFLYRDPRRGNTSLEALTAADPRLRPVPAVHPGMPDWQADLAERGARAPAVRAYPNYWNLEPAGGEMRALVAAAADCGCPVVLTVQFEDVRQRHHVDAVGNLPAAAVRSLARTSEGTRLIVTHADRFLIEEVHYGLTDAEAERILWDISWIWGPPEDHLQHLLETIGASRFAFGSGIPLRVPDSAIAKLDLLDISPATRASIESGNVKTFCL